MADYTPRILGVRNAEKVQGFQADTKTQGVQPTSGSQEMGSRLRAQTYTTAMGTLQNVIQSGQKAAGNAVQIAENLASIEEARGAEAAYKAAANKPTGSVATGLMALMQVANTASDVYSRLKEEKAKKEAAANAEVRAQNTATAHEEVTRLTTDAYTTLREKGGYSQYRTQVDDYLRQVRAHIDPEAYMKLTTELMAPIAQVQEDHAKERAAVLKETQEGARDITTQNALLKFSGIHARLANAATPEQQEAIMQEWQALFDTQAEGMAPYDRMILTRGLLTELRTSYDTSNQNFAKLETQLGGYENYIMALQEAQEEYNQTGDKTAYDIRNSQLKQQYGIAEADALNDPLAATRHFDERESLRRRIDAGVKADMLSVAEAAKFTEDETMTLAMTLYNDPSQRALYEAQYGDNPAVKRAIALADSVAAYDTNLVEYNKTANRLQREIQQLNVQNAESLASWLSSAGGQESMKGLLKNDGVRALLNAESQQLLAAMEGGQQEVDPEQLRALQQDVINQRTAIVPLLQEELSIAQQQLENAARPLRPYGLDQKEQRAAVVAGAQARMQGLNERTQNLQREVSANYGATPNFNLPRLETMTVGGVEVMVPFLDGKPEYLETSGHFGEQRRTHTHAGVDLAVPAGTGVIAYMQGTVTDVAHDPDGYGLYVTVKGQDGKYHRFAHMNSLRVSVGASIAPGQLIGVTGGQPGHPNAGSSEGPHVHWEIRDNADFSTGGALDPMTYMAGYKMPQSRQPRNGGRNSQIPARAMQNGDGSYIQNNQIVSPNGTARPVAYTMANPYRTRTQTNDKSAYPKNDGAGNFGYRALADNRELRLALHRTASNLGIPAQWLADVMNGESRFQKDIGNSIGATGLIQFIPETAAALGTSTEALARMTYAQQMVYVEKYLMEMKPLLKTANHVQMAVWGGIGNLRRYDEDPMSVRNMNDYTPNGAGVRWEEYANRLGEGAGRRYVNPYRATPLHGRYHAGCTTCEAIKASGSTIFPHEGS